MVRLSELMDRNQPGARPKASVTPKVPSAQRVEPAPSTPQEPAKEVPVHPEDASDDEVLYRELLAAGQRCMDDAQRERELKLGTLPELCKRLVDRLGRVDVELIRLSTRGEGEFSLATKGVNVAILGARVGMELGFKHDQLVELAVAGLLHDIGMVKVQQLIQSPAKFGPEERSRVREHPAFGHQLLEHCSDVNPLVREVVYQEHERYDGSGYPKGLRGKSIHDPAQIVGLLDLYEALIHDRPHRGRLLPTDAARTILQDQQSAFRSDFLRAFLGGVPIYPIGGWVRLSNGQAGQVVENNPRSPLAPTVTILINADDKPCRHPDTVNLSRTSRLTIVRAIPEPEAARDLSPYIRFATSGFGGRRIPV